LLYILFGQNDFTLREALEGIKRGLGDRDAVASNTTLFDGRQLTLDKLINVCSTMPFLGERRLVIVEGLLSRFEQEKGYSAWRGLKDYIPQMPGSTVLVMVDGRIGRSNPMLRELSTVATVREFPPIRGAELVRWIEKRVLGGGGSISPLAARALAELVGNNLWILSSEIEKLLLYCSGRPIEEGDVKAVVSYARESNVFEMVDAIVEGDGLGAARMAHKLLDEGVAAAYLLFMITRQLRLVIQAKDLRLRGLTIPEIKDRLGLTSDYVLRKTLGQADEYSMARLETVYRKLLETDISIKTGRRGEELALDLLIAELCQGG